MKTIITLSLLIFSALLFAQTTISGKILDEKGKPVFGATIFIEGTFDGTSITETGAFTLTTTATG